ncbi:uncharacterized protein A4U43_C03F20390 [Asparagus officinalis]|uniref:Calmodulin-binding domain-containing protein n=1 Tax=Asparagus officinalis TaxID=4686 RepID=A0A5P1FCF3_ASPOF|nr:uncharacterized serine-rich protein C215.13-like [Asparagus officinalis]XP_020257599.1 uncharacterized serine-rich protein C215.13-like [Asparagus officinalis]XP_020257600.1 uncharacterized serine-rich protein C215.13-like [Asparagus officinalis]ONK75772.1 uncharacterized protein A4U43_C03F20390 [Asparagus officinalis]
MDKEEVKKVIHSVTSNIGKTEEELRRNSNGKANTKTSPSLLSSNEKIISRYLKVSTNSCHDYCKYGKKHVFESKKRMPNLHMSSASSAIQNEEQTEVSTFQGRRKKQETKVNSTQSKVKSFEAPETEKISTPLLSCEGEGSSKEPIIVNTMTSSPIHQIEELSVTSETLSHQSSLPTEKRIISHDASTPLLWSEKSSERSESMELDSPSSTHTPKDQLKGSSEELGFETVTSLPVIASVGLEKTASLPTEKSVKAKIIPPTKKSTASSSRVVESSAKSLSMKLKTPKPKENQIENLKMVEGMKRGVDQTKMSPQLKTEQPTVVKKMITSAREKITSASVKLKVAEHKSPFSAKKVTMSESPIFTKQKESLVIKKIDGPAQPSISLKSTTPVVKSTATLISSRSASAQRNSTNKIVKSLDPGLKSSKASTSSKPSEIRGRGRSLKPLSPAKNRAKVGKPEDTNEKAKEKTLHVIEPKPMKASSKPKAKELNKNRAHSSSSTSSSPSSSSSSSSLSVSSHDKEESKKFECTLRKATELALAKDKTKRSKTVSSPKYNEKRRLTRIATATVLSETKAPSTYMMKFRRGKVINPMPENDTPRMLKFRQPKGTNEKNKDVVRTIQRRRVSSGSSAELIAPSLETPAVVLRHQDLQEKESQALFNDVIEETASKLVETRKSKVKALVGAFETVISLQESRVAPTV